MSKSKDEYQVNIDDSIVTVLGDRVVIIAGILQILSTIDDCSEEIVFTAEANKVSVVKSKSLIEVR